MKLIMAKEKVPKGKRFFIVERIGAKNLVGGLEGRSLREIQYAFENGTFDEEDFLITSDERFLKLFPQYLKLEDIFIYDDGGLNNIKDKTRRILRNDHNLMKLYMTNEFN